MDCSESEGIFMCLIINIYFSPICSINLERKKNKLLQQVGNSKMCVFYRKQKNVHSALAFHKQATISSFSLLKSFPLQIFLWNIFKSGLFLLFIPEWMGFTMLFSHVINFIGYYTILANRGCRDDSQRKGEWNGYLATRYPALKSVKKSI